MRHPSPLLIILAELTIIVLGLLTCWFLAVVLWAWLG